MIRYMSKIAILSDSHDNEPNIDKFINFCNNNQIACVIHCGDVTTEASTQRLRRGLKCPIYLVDGNADITSSTVLPRTNKFQRIKRRTVPHLEKTIDGLTIAACHEKTKALSLAKRKNFPIIFYGHTHKPWQEICDQSELINPGNLAGLFYPASFATLDTQSRKPTLHLLSDL